MPSITAVEQTSTPPRVLVSVTDLTVGDSLEVFREVAGVRTVIRGGSVEELTDASFLRVDAEFPFGVPMSYVARSSVTLINMNPGFEVNTTDWSTQGAGVTLTRSTAQRFSGVASGLITPAGVATPGIRTTLYPGVTPGDERRMRAWVFSPLGWSDVRACVTWYTAGGAEVSADIGDAVVVPPAAWTPVDATFVAPATAAQAAGRVRMGGTPAAGDLLYVDDAVLTSSVPSEISTAPMTVTLVDGMPVLSDAVSGLSVPVMIYSWPSQTADRESGVFQVGGRNVVVLGPVPQPLSEMTLRTTTPEQQAQLRDLLNNATNGIIQVRQPGGIEDIDSYQAVITVGRDRATARGHNTVRYWPLSLAETDPWAPELEARGFTLEDISNVYTDPLTLDDLSDDFTTLLAIAQENWT